VEFAANVVEVRPFVTVTLAIIVLFIGKALNRRFAVLYRSNISESVSGGLLVSLIIGAIYLVFDLQIDFNLAAREYFAVYFFTAIGINTSLRELLAARRLLAILLVATMVYMILQDGIALAVASLLGSGGPEALLAGTAALTGGQETAAEWTASPVGDLSLAEARTIGIATAALGVIMGSLTGGPLAGYLIRRHRLHPKTVEPGLAEGEEVSLEVPERGTIDGSIFLRAILAIHVCIIGGLLLNQLLADVGFDLPLAVACFFVAIVMTSTIPSLLPRAIWPRNTLAMSLIAELSLGTLFGVSLISAQVWLIVDLPPAFLTILLVQLAVTAAVTLFVIFRAMGRDYDAAVICAGFVGLALGSATTAMANIKAVTKHSGTSHIALIIVPLMTVVSIEAVNEVLLRFFLELF